MEDKLHNNILYGRPFGGTAVLVHKELSGRSYRITTDNPRITSVCIKNHRNAAIIVSSLYMPWSDRSLEQVFEYEAAVGCMQSIIDRNVGCNLNIRRRPKCFQTSFKYMRTICP